MHTRDIGKIGEMHATNYLEDKRYRILSNNFHGRTGELDIIAFDKNNTLVFIEVKSIAHSSFGDPSYNISLSKQKRIIRASLKYMNLKKLFSYNIRYDAICIYLSSNYTLKDVIHYENAFEYM